MFKKYLIGPSGKNIYSNLTDECLTCLRNCDSENEIVEECHAFSEKRRRGKRIGDRSLIYLCTSNKDFVKSGRIFKEKMNVYSEVLSELEILKQEIKDDQNQENKRLIHNLTSLNAHSIQELYNLVPQDLLTKNYKDQIKTIKVFISGNLNEAASTFLRIAKNNASMKTEFSVFKKLYESNPVLQVKKHPIRKVVFNLLHIFFQDFTDEGIYVNVGENFDTLFFDYESLHVALYHIFENATKYARPAHEITILFEKFEAYFDLIIQMNSIQITEQDFIKIFEEGYSGVFAKKLNRAGSGIGLSRVKKILELNKADLIIRRNIKPYLNSQFNGIPYEYNEFVIRFKI